MVFKNKIQVAFLRKKTSILANFCNIFQVYNNFTVKWPGNSESAPLITPISIKTQKWKFWRFFFQNFCTTWNHRELPTHTILFQHQHFHSPRKWNIHTLSSTHCVAEVFPEINVKSPVVVMVNSYPGWYSKTPCFIKNVGLVLILQNVWRSN